MLIGRAAEKRRLKSAVADTASGLVVVQGPSGVGKTALIDAALAELCADGAICGRGKYAQGRASSAFAPIVQALSQAASSALDLLYDPAAGAASLQTVMGAQKAQLAAAGFEALDSMPAVTPSAAASSESAIQLVDAIARIMRWLDGFGVPVILFVDDWQRAPAEAQSFAALAAREHGQQLCTVILAERTGEERAAHAVRTKSETIVVGPLSAEERAALLDNASGDSGAGATIAEWLGASASGLPLDLLEAARALRERDALTFQEGRWIIDTARAAAIDRADFSETIVRRARALPADVLELGVALALWGDRVPLQAIADALGQSFGAVVERVAALTQAGLVRVADGVAIFVHDRLRAALLDAVAPEVRAALAGQMAERLVVAAAYSQPAIARTTLQLRLTGGLDHVQPAVWRDRFAVGAVAARTIADASAAAAFAEAAWALQQRGAARDAEMTRLITREALFAAAMRHDVQPLHERAGILVGYAGTPQQISEAYESVILVARLIGDFERAWQWSVEGMRRFGLKLPAKAKLHHVALSTAYWQFGFTLERFRRVPVRPAQFDPLSRLCNIGALVAFEREPLQAMLIALRAASRARRRGLRAPIWLATDSFICANFGDYRRAAALGAEALAIPSTFLRAAVLYRALYFGMIWNRPLASLRPQCLSIYSIAMAEGDLATAALAIRNDSLLAWRSETTLAGLIQSLGENEEKGERLGDARALRAIRKFTTFARALQKPGGLSDLAEEAVRNNNPDALEWQEDMPLVRIEVLAVRGEWEALVAMGEEMKSIRRSLNSHPGAIIWRFYESIARLRVGLPMRRGDMRLIRRIAALNPSDHRAKVLLLEAEELRLKGKRAESLRGYALAVEMSAGIATRFEAGIIAECAAFGARVLGDEAAAARHDAAAQASWQAWGAFGKLKHTAEATLGRDASARIAEAESQTAAAVRAERAKSRFLAEVGHELRTPLQAMQGLLDIAADQKQTVDIAELRDVFGSLRSVVDDLTDMGALGADAPLRLAPVDLGQIVESEAALFGALARRKGLSFREEMACEPDCLMRIDGPRVRQIVRNLLSNAVKYVDRGDIVLKLHAHGIGENTVAVTLAVEDTGPGLREADLAKLFEPFERGARTDPEGLGLGLALSRSIAQRMGGKLTADNREGGGARFVLTFTAERARDAASPPVAAQPGRILLVEDVALNRRLLATLLGNAGHVVQEAADGGEALACWGAGVFDLVILDLGLPDMNGLAVLERMRASETVPVPVIVLTASAGDATDVRAHEAGATVVLHKPISAAELREAVAEVLQQPVAAGIDSADLAHALAGLAQEAHDEIRLSSRDLLIDALQGDGAEIARKAHRLAGLAGQFGEARLAEAADLLEHAARSGGDRSSAVRAIEAAMAVLAA